ncbi:tetratricopeptide repeat protein [Mycolicibacterium sp.]|uniref:tetratricopeptide repeat protein n=1 Tax=Mycolicibacterium sp. TaxID=2320850 RepID=UPI0025FC8282|nr:tetratricopeptide repeat protein [Mycolicibacterium sp.]
MTGAVDLSGLKQPARQPGGGSTPGAVAVTEATFEAEVLVRSTQVPVIVVLWSPRSEACMAMVDALAGMAAADGGKWVLATINVDVESRVAQMFGVEAVPAVIALAAGRPLDSFQGVQPPEQLRGWIDALLAATAGKLSGPGDSAEPEAVDPALLAAQDLVDAGDFPGAVAAFQAILDKDPNHVEAKGALRQITFLERASIQPADTLERAEADPDDIEAAFGAADVQILSQDISGAFDRLIGLIKRTTGDDRTKVRTRLIELFELFDPADPDVIAGRRNLANALY